MNSQYVVEGYVLDYGGVGDDELHILRTVDAHRVPEGEQRLLVGVHRHAGLAQPRVEQFPQVAQVLPKLQHTLCQASIL